MWAGMKSRQKYNYKKQHPLLYSKFKMEVLNKDIAPSQAAQSEGLPSEAAPSEEAPSEGAPSEAARVEAEKIRALQQKMIEADMEAKRERKARLLKKKEKESQPEAEISTDGPSEPSFSEPKESTDVVGESQNEPEKTKEREILYFMRNHIISKERGSLSSKDQQLTVKGEF